MSRVDAQNTRLPVVDRIIYKGKITNSTQVNIIPINTKTKQLKCANVNPLTPIPLGGCYIRLHMHKLMYILWFGSRWDNLI